jgi:hypothetical protein
MTPRRGVQTDPPDWASHALTVGFLACRALTVESTSAMPSTTTCERSVSAYTPSKDPLSMRSAVGAAVLTHRHRRCRSARAASLRAHDHPKDYYKSSTGAQEGSYACQLPHLRVATRDFCVREFPSTVCVRQGVTAVRALVDKDREVSEKMINETASALVTGALRGAALGNRTPDLRITSKPASQRTRGTSRICRPDSSHWMRQRHDDTPARGQ